MNLALFDFDGTLTTRDTFLPFFATAVPRARLLAAGLIISPILIGHRLKVVSSPRVRPWLAWSAFAGMPAGRILSAGQRYAEDVLPGAIDAGMMARARQHQHAGDTVVVVSAGLDVYLRPWCSANGLTLICSELEMREGRCTGRYRRGDCSGIGKARLVQADLDMAQFDGISAYGDTAEDRELLALAHRRYFRGVELHPGQQVG